MKILNLSIIYFVLLLLFGLSGCTIGGELYFLVKGKIPRLEPQKPNSCSLYIKDSQVKYFASTLDTDFSYDLFIGEPFPFLTQNIVFIVECEDGRHYKSIEYQLGSRTYREHKNGEIDLGELTMTP